jgi:hypothetical protein
MLGEPREFLVGDDVMGRVARVDIGLAEQFEAAAAEPVVAGPGFDQRGGDLFALRAEEIEAVGFGALCRAADYAEWAWNSAPRQHVADNSRGIVSRSLRLRGNEGLPLPAEIARIQWCEMMSTICPRPSRMSWLARRGY